MDNLNLHFADNRTILPTLEKNSVDCVFTSPPYWGLRDYGTGANSVWDDDPDCEHEWNEVIKKAPHGEGFGDNKAIVSMSEDSISGLCHCGAWKGQLGLEPTWQLFIKHMVEISSLIKRVLKPTGSYYLVMGDTYAGSGGAGGDYNPGGMREGQPKYKQNHYRDVVTKPKQLLLIPSRLAIALQEDGWTLRNKIIWYKTNHMPSSVKDRLTNSYEEIFHFVQNRKYYYDLDSIREPHKYQHQPPGNKLIEPGRTPISVDNPTKRARPPKEQSFNVAGKNPSDVQKWENPDGQTAQQFARKKHSGYLDENGELMVNPLGKNPSDFFKSNTKPYPEAHFAVFPEDICIPRIKSSTPKEVCVSCGKARERIIEKGELVFGDGHKRLIDRVKVDETGMDAWAGRGAKGERMIPCAYYENKTIGWTKCSCQADFEPGVVLDPFAGTGTTGKVALDLGRKAILIEINQDYQELIERRLSVHNPEWLEKYAISDAKENGIIPLSEWI